MVELFGEKLKGQFALIRTGNDNKWLLIKKKDDYADYHLNILEERPESVLSGKEL